MQDINQIIKNQENLFIKTIIENYEDPVIKAIMNIRIQAQNIPDDIKKFKWILDSDYAGFVNSSKIFIEDYLQNKPDIEEKTYQINYDDFSGYAQLACRLVQAYYIIGDETQEQEYISFEKFQKYFNNFFNIKEVVGGGKARGIIRSLNSLNAITMTDSSYKLKNNQQWLILNNIRDMIGQEIKEDHILKYCKENEKYLLKLSANRFINAVQTNRKK